MKWIFLLALILMVPVLSGWLRANPRNLTKVAMAMGFLPLVDTSITVIAPVAWPMWPGFVKGMEISIVDAMALAILLAAPASQRRFRLGWPIILYMAVVTVSVFQATQPTPAAFYAWQLGRVLLVASAIAVASREPRVPEAVLTGLILGLSYQAVLAGYASLVGGATQAGGTLGHQNTLGLFSHYVGYAALALMLGGRKHWRFWLGPLAAVAVVIFTASRAAIGFAGMGFIALFVLSMVRRPTSRKTAIVAAGMVALAVATPLAIGSLERRFAAAPLVEGYDERGAFEKAAWMMMADRPLGVGPNNYVLVANTKGYSERAGVIWNAGSRSAHVHNAYLLAGAEAGYLGLVAFMLFVLVPVYVAFRAAWKFRRDPRSELLVGLGVGLGVVCIHSLYEWIFMTAVSQTLYALTVGMIGGLAQQMGYWGQPRMARRPTPSAGEATAHPAPQVSA